LHTNHNFSVVFGIDPGELGEVVEAGLSWCARSNFLASIGCECESLFT
jgi:hypothetical protein